MYNQAVIIASEESKDKKDRKECTAVALRLKPKNEITRGLLPGIYRYGQKPP